MPKTRPTDAVGCAVHVGRIAIGELPNDPPPDPVAQRNGQQGGRERAERLTPERRKAIAQQAARARWHKRHPSP